jgi:hypothetical protein
MAQTGRKRGLLSGWDIRQAVMVVANMVESLLHGGSDDAEHEDRGVASVAVGDRLPVD